MARIAFFTLNVAREPFSQPQMRGFVERIPAIFAEASAAPGFIAFAPAMSLAPDDPAMVWPAAKPADHEAAMTLTLWRNLESVFAFAYSRLHAEALQIRREWTVRPAWPTYVAWWIADDEEPTWRDAAQRHEWLTTRGSTPDAFDFRIPFDAQGRPTPPAHKPLGLVSPAQGKALRAASVLPSMTLSGDLPPR
jgi:hypothetical protein